MDAEAPEQDLEQARSLAEAGHENLEVTLHTSDIVPGFVEARRSSRSRRARRA